MQVEAWKELLEFEDQVCTSIIADLNLDDFEFFLGLNRVICLRNRKY